MRLHIQFPRANRSFDFGRHSLVSVLDLLLSRNVVSVPQRGTKLWNENISIAAMSWGESSNLLIESESSPKCSSPHSLFFRWNPIHRFV